MIEKALCFGKEKTLSGILTLPQNTSASKKTAVVMMNAGIGLRTGPFRMQVDLARLLAQGGFSVLRFDLSGLGDSPVANGKTVAEVREVEELRAALDVLQQMLNAEEFVVFGFCTGAVLGLKTALLDNRITGLIFLDGYAYRTASFFVRRILQRVFSRKRWSVYFRTRILALFKNKPVAQLTEGFKVIQPRKETVEGDLLMLGNRGVKQAHIYTNSADQFFNHNRQFLEMFPSLKNLVERGQLQSWYLKNMDHSLSIYGARKSFFSEIVSWVCHQFI